MYVYIYVYAYVCPHASTNEMYMSSEMAFCMTVGMLMYANHM